MALFLFLDLGPLFRYLKNKGLPLISVSTTVVVVLKNQVTGSETHQRQQAAASALSNVNSATQDVEEAVAVTNKPKDDQR